MHDTTFGAFTNSFDNLGLLALVFLELPKKSDFGRCNLKHWVDFFKGNELDQEAPDYIQEACRLSSEQSLSSEEVAVMNAINKAEEDRKAQLSYARREGIREGIREGCEAKALEMAQRALVMGLSLEDVSKLTDLDMDIVKSLQE